MPAPLTQDEHQKRLELYNAGLSDDLIAQELCLSKYAVAMWRRRHNLPANRQTRVITKEKLEALNTGELSCYEIAKKLGVSRETIVRCFKEFGIKKKPKKPVRRKKATQWASGKYDAQMVEAIKRSVKRRDKPNAAYQAAFDNPIVHVSIQTGGIYVNRLNEYGL